jgi:hypothetical protein
MRLLSHRQRARRAQPLTEPAMQLHHEGLGVCVADRRD